MKTLHIQQIPLFSAIVDELTRQAKEQGITLYAVPRQMNTVIRCANEIITEFRREPVPATPGMGLDAWLACDDTGTSSLAMARRMFDRGAGEDDHPRDPSDFGRCYRFLRAVPGAPGRLSLMADVSPVWANLVPAWAYLEALYEQGEAGGTALYDKMKTLGC